MMIPRCGLLWYLIPEGNGPPSQVSNAKWVTLGSVTRQGMMQFSPVRSRMTFTMVCWKAFWGSEEMKPYFHWLKLLDRHKHFHVSYTHLSHTHRWSCVPLCCCWRRRSDPCGKLAQSTPWCMPLRPLLSLPPACETSPSTTSAWLGHQMSLHCHGSAVPASPTWELLYEVHWGWWLACTTLEQMIQMLCIHFR